MTELYYKREDCRLCGSRDVDLVIHLEPMPIATPNFKVLDSTENASVFKDAVPLELFLCRNCGHLQILHVGNREIQYSNYVYTTSVSLGLREHFARYAEAIDTRLGFPNGSMVMEFGSNDGTLLRYFKDRGKSVQGIDPAAKIAEAATKSGIPTVASFFSHDVAKQIKSDHGPAKILFANNVLANIDDLEDIALGIRELIDTDGVFVSETQYGADVIVHTLLDTVYHEHLSYFNVKPLKSFFSRYGLQLVDVERIDTKGGSIRIIVQHQDGPFTQTASVDDMIAEEEAAGFYGSEIYAGFATNVANIKSELMNIITEQNSQGKSVAGYGVSVGTTAMLPQFALTDKIDFFLDDDPTKTSFLSGPGYNIPVYGPDEIYKQSPGAIIVFAWRYAPNIIPKHQRYVDSGGKFVIPLPRVQIKV
jgi:hypothetical protein